MGKKKVSMTGNDLSMPTYIYSAFFKCAKHIISSKIAYHNAVSD